MPARGKRTEQDRLEARAPRVGIRLFVTVQAPLPHVPVHVVCAGIFSAPAALEMYAQAFDEEGALDKFEAFASLNGPAFYGLAVNEETLTLKKGEGRVPGDVPVQGGEAVKPFLAGAALTWAIVD